MGDKDLGCKALLSINEVFCDVFNVLSFDGRRLIDPESLMPASEESQYRAGGKYRYQRRDVSKIWNKCGVRLALFCIENENKASIEMPLRMMSYDGGEYRRQLKDEAEKFYPVISMVLNFNTERRWDKPKNLKGVLKIPEGLEPLINDYKINVVDVAFLDREVIEKFESDFYVVADYFWKLRHLKEYEPSDRTIKHVQEVMQMMSAMTGDNRFEIGYNEWKDGGGEVRMDRFLDQAEAKGRETGIKNLVETCVEFAHTPEDIIEKLMSKYSLSQEEAQLKVDMYTPKVA